MTIWEQMDEELRHEEYEGYIAEIRYEWGDNAKVPTYEECCKESEKYGEPIGRMI